MIDMPSHNYLVLKPHVLVGASLQTYLDQPMIYSEARDTGTLYGFDMAWVPAHRREARRDCVQDLEFEITLQRFLGTLKVDDFLLVRAGPYCDYRGTWQDHPFRDVEMVATVNLLFRRQAGALGLPLRSTRHVTSADVSDVLKRAHALLNLAKHSLPPLDTHHLMTDLITCAAAMRDGLREDPAHSIEHQEPRALPAFS